jgi:hypothetical protein
MDPLLLPSDCAASNMPLRCAVLRTCLIAPVDGVVEGVLVVHQGQQLWGRQGHRAFIGHTHLYSQHHRDMPVSFFVSAKSDTHQKKHMQQCACCPPVC